jgi:hypothetical protein
MTLDVESPTIRLTGDQTAGIESGLRAWGLRLDVEALGVQVSFPAEASTEGADLTLLLQPHKCAQAQLHRLRLAACS